MPPTGLAKFDSATAMLQALAQLLHGQEFRGLGQSDWMQMLVRQADRVPQGLRKQLFARLGAREGITPQQIGEVDTAAIADWAASLYPHRRYPAVMVGSSSGALIHLAAAFGLPWLPQTFLTLLDQPDVSPDDAQGAMEHARAAGQRFLAANPDVQLHHMQDPSQDRLMLDYITYFRFKYRRLPSAYRQFLERSLQPNGTIVIADCGKRWPVTRLAERHVFQFGALGGLTAEEYRHGGERVERFLREQGSPFQHWQPPPADEQAPEAEWGFEPALADDIAEFARQRGYRVVRLNFDDPERLSAPVAELYRHWYSERNLPDNRLVIESFVLLEPYWMLRTASVPYWMSFNMQPSLQALEQYLSITRPYDYLHLMLFAHGADSAGLPPIDDWQRLLARARVDSSLLGIDPDSYPAHFSIFARYSEQLRALSATHHPLPPALEFERLEDFIAQVNRS